MSRRTGSREESLLWRTDQLSDALDVGGAELNPERAQAGEDLVAKVRQRWALKGSRTVVALAGATGSGKSSLFNALAGEDVSSIGVRRPTTSKAAAAIWGASDDASELLDWLGIDKRHHVADDSGTLDGLILVDLPDFDSTEVAHRQEADRILERSDVFVWVTDPQKYADARLHNEYLAPLQDHDTVMLVVLNQIDRIQDPGGAERIKADLAKLVAADGAGEFDVIGTSARLRDGLAELRGAIGEVVARRNAAEQRLVGDLKGTARGLLQDVGDVDPKLDRKADHKLVLALEHAAGVPVVLDAVQRDYLRQAGDHVGWPFTRWVSALRPDPLRRLRLSESSDRPAITESDVKTALGRSSLPPPSPAARSAVDLATRQVGETAGAGLPPRWADAVAAAATPESTALADSLDQAVMNTPLRARNPMWWQLVNLLQWLLALIAIGGLAWLVVLGALGFLQIDAEVPMYGPLPIPVLMLGGGLLLGILLALGSRAIARVGARRRRQAIEGRLASSVAEVAHEHVSTPVTAVLDRHKQARQQLQAAAK
ncbi:GTPase [Ornithinimicrobium cryptoxanthini]|uniref:50S ribosome-binding GTPase n=1 Tax=Ornithinimicrobium cryptoxanthini TaxID=2934161 RepID=A0ABY4YFE5_9MICO|nr:GTPase [Ornithinimicrobium cryptoxanthini]USQ75487.1 50S ribosome-binding GTPase [Ornithinimicrobium cryptoxanthini]